MHDRDHINLAQQLTDTKRIMRGQAIDGVLLAVMSVTASCLLVVWYFFQ